ncbi:MAG: hypothetical protein AAGG50_03045 [Bacteroidota bacterium]
MELLDAAETLSSILVNTFVVFAAIFGAYQFRMHRKYQNRYNTYVKCNHYVNDNDEILLEAKYYVNNLGDRPISLSRVEIKAMNVLKFENGVAILDYNNIICERTITRKDLVSRGIFDIQAEERSIFTMRCLLNDLDPIIMVACEIEWVSDREPSTFSSLYIRDKTSSSAISVGSQGYADS